MGYDEEADSGRKFVVLFGLCLKFAAAHKCECEKDLGSNVYIERVVPMHVEITHKAHRALIREERKYSTTKLFLRNGLIFSAYQSSALRSALRHKNVRVVEHETTLFWTLHLH